MGPIQGFAVAGLNAAAKRVAIRAENIVNAQSEGYRPAVPVQTSTAAGPVVRAERLPADRAQQSVPGTGLVIPEVDLATEFTDIMVSETAYKASASLLKTSRDMDRALLDIVS